MHDSIACMRDTQLEASEEQQFSEESKASVQSISPQQGSGLLHLGAANLASITCNFITSTVSLALPPFAGEKHLLVEPNEAANLATRVRTFLTHRWQFCCHPHVEIAGREDVVEHVVAVELCTWAITNQ